MNEAVREMPLSENPATPAAARGFWKKFFGNAIVRILLGAVVLIGLHPLVGISFKFVTSVLPAFGAWVKSAPLVAGTKSHLPAYYITHILITVLCFPVYRLFVRWSEGRRSTAELSTNGAAAETALGVLAGFALFSGVAAILWAGGFYHVKAINSPAALIPVFVMSASAAVFEELLFRGLLFRIIEQSLGSWTALAVSSLFFGLAHLANPEASVQAALAIAIEAGMLLGVAYMATQRLWLVIGLHLAWNFSESGIYGMPVSGFSMPGLLQGEVSGPELITGGAFGAENSIVAVVLCLIVAFGFLHLARKRGRIVKRSWRRAG